MSSWHICINARCDDRLSARYSERRQPPQAMSAVHNMQASSIDTIATEMRRNDQDTQNGIAICSGKEGIRLTCDGGVEMASR